MTHDPKRYIIWMPITCPKCGSRHCRVRRTMPIDGFGYQDRYVVCGDCCWKFVATTPPAEKVSSTWKTPNPAIGE